MGVQGFAMEDEILHKFLISSQFCFIRFHVPAKLNHTSLNQKNENIIKNHIGRLLNNAVPTAPFCCAVCDEGMNMCRILNF